MILSMLVIMGSIFRDGLLGMVFRLRFVHVEVTFSIERPPSLSNELTPHDRKEMAMTQEQFKVRKQ
jgi:hypothetical protein